MMKIGAQFYTLRDYCQDLEGFAESLKRVANIGYRVVQISGTCEFEAEWLNEQLKQNDLQCVLTHTAPQKLQGDIAKVAAEHTIFGSENVGLGFFSFREENENEGLEDFIRIYKPIAKELKKQGKYFMFHHHEREFMKHNGKRIIDILEEEFAPDEMGFTLDTYWVQVAGADPAQWIERLKGRVPCIHLKDCAFGRRMEVLGEGNINFDRIFEKAEMAGTKYIIVEQDECNGEDPFDCLKRSYEYLRARGFE